MSALAGKCETAWKAVLSGFDGIPLRADGETPAVYKGREAADLERDRVVVEWLGGPEEPTGTGNRKARVRVAVFAGADAEEDEDGNDEADPLARNDELCGVFEQIVEAIGDGTLVEGLTEAAADFHVFEEGIEDEGEEPDIEDRGWVSARIYSVYCCGRDLS